MELGNTVFKKSHLLGRCDGLDVMPYTAFFFFFSFSAPWSFGHRASPMLPNMWRDGTIIASKGLIFQFLYKEYSVLLNPLTVTTQTFKQPEIRHQDVSLPPNTCNKSIFCCIPAPSHPAWHNNTERNQCYSSCYFQCHIKHLPKVSAVEWV